MGRRQRYGGPESRLQDEDELTHAEEMGAMFEQAVLDADAGRFTRAAAAREPAIFRVGQDVRDWVHDIDAHQGMANEELVAIINFDATAFTVNTVSVEFYGQAGTDLREIRLEMARNASIEWRFGNAGLMMALGTPTSWPPEVATIHDMVQDKHTGAFHFFYQRHPIMLPRGERCSIVVTFGPETPTLVMPWHVRVSLHGEHRRAISIG